jgi:hypothetical protein
MTCIMDHASVEIAYSVPWTLSAMPSHLDVQPMRVAWDAGRLGLRSDRNFEVEARAPEEPQGPGRLLPGPPSPPRGD